MKKLFLSALLVGLFLIPTTNVSAQNENRETSHWSLGVRGGGTYFRVSPNAGDHMENMSWGVGGVLEYGINPLWGFGLSVDLLNFNRGDDMPGRTIDAGLFGSVNLLNLLSPNRTGWRRGGVYFNLGGGLGFYNSEVVSQDIHVDGIAHFGLIGLGIEIPLGNTFALFGEGQYRRYAMSDDHLGGLPSHKNDAYFASLGLRMKFNANRRDHVRNTRPATYRDEINALRSDLRQLQGQADKTASDVNNLDRRVNDDRRQQDATNQHLQNEIDELRRELEALRNQQVVVFSNIEFQFDSHQLKPTSFAALDRIAADLRNDTNWTKLTLTGHTDNVGSNAVNQRLSVRRAEAVKAYLVQQGVPASKIEVVGRGAEQPIATNNTREGRAQNRRVEFQLSR